jgi:hypothetical protein
MGEVAIARLRQEIVNLKVEKADREKALPAHSIRPHQLLAIEDLEEEIERRQRELDVMLSGTKNTA